MAARTLRPRHQDDVSRFYVYKLCYPNGDVAYIGKGSGRRLRVQKKKYGLSGEIISSHSKETEAYLTEIKQIALLSPPLNKHKGGNGARATQKRRNVDKFYRECNSLGTHVVAARLCLKYLPLLDPSKIDAIRQVAYGCR